jgi:hypothetical protein
MWRSGGSARLDFRRDLRGRERGVDPGIHAGPCGGWNAIPFAPSGRAAPSPWRVRSGPLPTRHTRPAERRSAPRSLDGGRSFPSSARAAPSTVPQSVERASPRGFGQALQPLRRSRSGTTPAVQLAAPAAMHTGSSAGLAGRSRVGSTAEAVRFHFSARHRPPSAAPRGSRGLGDAGRRIQGSALATRRSAGTGARAVAT